MGSSVPIVGSVVSGLSGYADAKKAKKEAKRAESAMARQRGETLEFAGPENFLDLYNQYLQTFQDIYRPSMLSGQQALAFGSNRQGRAIDTMAGRRGNVGGGMWQAAHQGREAARTAGQNENLRSYYQQALTGARDEAGQTAGRQTNASLGAPWQYVPRGPSGLQTWTGVARDAMGGYGGTKALMGGGGGKGKGGSPGGPWDLGGGKLGW